MRDYSPDLTAAIKSDGFTPDNAVYLMINNFKCIFILRVHGSICERCIQYIFICLAQTENTLPDVACYYRNKL